MVYTGLLIYLVLLYIRPADWVAAVLGWPLEMIVMTITIIGGLARLYTRPQEDSAGRTPHFRLLVIWVVVIFLSNLVHGNFLAGYNAADRYLKISLMFVVIWLALDSIAKLRGAVILMMTLSALLGLQTIYQIQHGVGWAGQPLYWGGRVDWIGLWDGANVLSLLFVMIFPFVLEIILGPWPVILKVVAAGCGGLIMEGLILANSRGAWLSLAIITMVFFQKRIGKAGLIVGCVALFGLLLLAPSRMEQSDERDTSSTAGRIDMWSEGLEMFKYNPVLGIGKGEFVNYTHKQVAHNTFIQNMGETGFIGLMVWVSLVYVSMSSLKVVLEHPQELNVQLISLTRATWVGMIGYLSGSMFLSVDFEPLYILMAVSAVVLRIARMQSGLPLEVPFNAGVLRKVMGICVVGILGMYFLTMLSS